MNLLREIEDPTTFREVRDTIGGFYSGLADDPEGRVMHHIVNVPMILKPLTRNSGQVTGEYTPALSQIFRPQKFSLGL